MAALELALVLPVLALLALGMMDYGYYMFVSITTQQAAREGAHELALRSVTNCANATAVNAAIANEQGSSGAAKVYMNQIGMSGSTTVTATCLTSPTDPTWSVTVQVNYRPTIGYLLAKGLMPSGGSGNTRVNATLKMRGH